MRAFTFGRDIILGPGEDSTDVKLLAHEAAHVLHQQSKARIQAKSAARGDTMENEADQAAAATQNQQEFAVKERVSSQNGRQKKDGESDVPRAGKPDVHTTRAKSEHAAPGRGSHQDHGTLLPEAATEDEAAGKKTKEISDRDATSQLRGNWASLSVEIPAASLFSIPFEAPHSLDLHPRPSSSGTKKESPEEDQNKTVREAVESYTGIHREAGSAHSRVIAKSNDVRRDVVSQGRDTLRHVDQVLEMALDGAVTALATDRSTIDSAAVSALQALDRGEALARIQLGGASAAGHQQIAGVAAMTAARITKIELDLYNRFQALYSLNAGAIEMAGQRAAETLRSPELHDKVQKKIQDGAGPTVVDAAEIEAESASVPRYLVEFAPNLERSSAEQAEALRGRMDTKPPSGDTLRESIGKFAEGVRTATIGPSKGTSEKDQSVTSGAGGGASAAPSTIEKNPKESLKSQSDSSVRQAHSMAVRSLRDQVTAARKSIEAARLSAQEQCSAQRQAVFAQLTNLRQTYVANIQHATANAARTIEEGARSAVTMYPETCRSVALSLKDAAQKSSGELAMMARTGVLGALQSVEAAQAMQTSQLTQVGDDARGALVQQGTQAGEASSSVKESFLATINTITLTSATGMADAATRQVQGFKGLSTGIVAAAANFTRQLDTHFKKSVVRSQKPYEDYWHAEEKSVPESTKATCKQFADSALPDNALKLIQAGLDGVAKIVFDNLSERAKSAHAAWGFVTLNEDALMASLRGVTKLQGIALNFLFTQEFGKGPFGMDLRAKLKFEYDDWPGGLNADEYNACINYLDGNTSQGALYELKTAKGWFSSDSAKAETVLRSLTPAESRDVKASPEWSSVASDVRSGLSGVNLDVFNALAEGQAAKADALQLRENLRKAKENNDQKALFKAIEHFRQGGDDNDPLMTVRADIAANQQAPRVQQAGSPGRDAPRKPAIGETVSKVEFEQVQNEFAKLEPAPTPTAADAGKQQGPGAALAAYVLAPVSVQIPNEDGPPTTVTYKVEGPDAVLAGALANKGPDSVAAKAARLYRESETKDTTPGEELENAVIDPRLNKSLPQGRGLNPEQLAQAIREHNEVLLEYTSLLKANGAITETVTDPEQARKIASQHLVSHFDVGDEKGLAGAQYASSLVMKDVPDAAAAMRYAQLGWGTDEDLINRTFDRMSRADIDASRKDYESRYGSDLFADLGLYGKGSFGELSGDDRLKAEVKAMGVPQNAKEASEVALFTNLQQKNETGWVGRHLVGDGEADALAENEKRLRQMTGITETDVDDLGRPKAPDASTDLSRKADSKFDKEGNYIGGSSREFDRELTMAHIAAENYEDSIDRVTTAVTTSIAIIGAVAATVATAGAASPLILALIAGGAGVASMGASYAIKGGRYGWEQALTDLGTTGVQMLTAGVGAKLADAAKAAAAVTEVVEAAEVAEGTAATVAKEVAKDAPTLAETVKSGAKIGAITGGIGGAGGTALDERTWKDGIGTGFGRVALGGARGAVGGAAGGAVSGALEHIPLGGSTLGEFLHSNSVEGANIEDGAARMILGGVGRGVVSSAGGIAGRAGELGFDEATGQYQGTIEEALASLAEAGEQPLMQGFFEGAAHTAAKPWTDRRQAMLTERRQAQARKAGMPAPAPESLSPRRPEEQLHPPPALDQEAPSVHPAPDTRAGVPGLSLPEATPVMPILPDVEAMTLPKQPFEADGAGGGGGMHPPGAPPPPSSGGEPLFPNLTDAEIDALFEQAASGPMVEARGGKTLDESLGLRLPGAQGGEYWGMDPASGMTVQEYRFLSERGLPAVDSKGDPVPGPRGNKMTKMRIHSPDASAPEGSASHEGWTVNFEQGDHLRMTAEGVWFDRRYGALPDGMQLDVRPYRRGPAGNWVEEASGNPVTDPDHISALENWDRNMASSHIPLFPEAHARPTPPSGSPAPTRPPETPPPTGQAPEDTPPAQASSRETSEAETSKVPKPKLFDKAAAGIEGSRFTGDAAEKLGLPHAESPDEAIRNLLDHHSPIDRYAVPVSRKGPITEVELETRAVDLETSKPVKVNVRFEMVDTMPLESGVMPVAKFEQIGSKNEYLVLISKGAPAAALERGIAHELTEIRAAHGAISVLEEHALTPQSHAATLTPHDEGRLAEVGVLAKQLSKATGAERRLLLDETQKLVEHLGLTGKGDAVEARKALALNYLEGRLNKKWLNIAIDLAEENPFDTKLGRKLSGLPADLATLSRRIALHIEMGDLRAWTNLAKTEDPIILQMIDSIAGVLVSQNVVRFKPGTRIQHGVPSIVEEEAAHQKIVFKADRIREGLPENSPERTLFDRALVRALEPGARELATGPTEGYEAKLTELQTPGLKLQENINLSPGESNPRIVSVKAAVDERLKALRLDEQIRQATKDGNSDLAQELNKQRNLLPSSATNISEAFGIAAGLAFKDMQFPGATVFPIQIGARVFDLLVKVNGEYVIIECKGGTGRVESRWDYREQNRVEQGTREYAIAIANDLRKSTRQPSEDPTQPNMKEVGEELFKKLTENPNYKPRYFIVNQPFDGDERPLPPIVSEADMSSNDPTARSNTYGKGTSAGPKK